LEQSLMEVRQEEELKAIRRSKASLDTKAEQEAAEAQARHQKERELHADKEKRLAEARKRAQRERDLEVKLQCQALARANVWPLQHALIDRLEAEGYITDPARKGAEGFMPWLQKQVEQHLSSAQNSQKVVDELIHGALHKANGEREAADDARRRQQEEEAKRSAARKAAEEEQARRKRKVELFIHTNIVPQSPVGPIQLSANSTVQQVEDKIVEWMNEHMDEPPAREKLKFLWNGAALEPSSVLYDVGIDNLSKIEMLLEDDKENEGEESGGDA